MTWVCKPLEDIEADFKISLLDKSLTSSEIITKATQELMGSWGIGSDEAVFILDQWTKEAAVAIADALINQNKSIEVLINEATFRQATANPG